MYDHSMLAHALELKPLSPLLLKWLKEVKGLLKLDIGLQRELRISVVHGALHGVLLPK